MRSPDMERLWEWLPRLPGNASDDEIAREALRRILELRTEIQQAHDFLTRKGLFQEFCGQKKTPAQGRG